MTTSTSGCAVDAPEGGGDPRSGGGALHAGLGNDDVSGREAGVNPGHDIAARRGVGSRDDADGTRKARQRALALGREQPFVGQGALEALDRGEVVAEADPLDRDGAEAQLAARFVDLGLALDEHALAVAEPERESVEAAPWHRRAQAGATRRVLECEEDERPRVVAAQLRDLTLDPQHGQPTEVDPDPLVERGDAEDLAVAVERCFDLHPGRVDVAGPAACAPSA